MTKNQKPHILMAGGGTGGHVMPIANIIQTIDIGDYPEAEIYRYGQVDSLENTVCKKINQTLSRPVHFRHITSGKVRRDRSITSLFRNLRDMIKVIRGTIQATRYMSRDHIDVIWCKGGYVAGPVIFASRILRIPLVVHESDTRMGLINRLAARGAKAIFTAFPGVYQREQVIGQLLSDTLAEESSRTDFDRLLDRKTDADQTHILVVGGSQGSQSLYETIAQHMKEKPDVYGVFTFVVIGGILSQNLQKLFEPYENVIVLDFLEQDELRVCYQFCDIAITRAGTTSLAEQKLRDMLLLMVPIPRTHDQKTNAERYARQYTDILIEQNDALGEQLTTVLATLQNYHKTSHNTTKTRTNIIQKPKQTLIDTLFTLTS